MLNIAEERRSYGCINCKKEIFNSFWHIYNHHFEPSVTITFHNVCHTLKSLCITELLQNALILHELKGTHHGCFTCNDSLFWMCFSPLIAFNFLVRPTTLTKNQSSQHNEVEEKITYDKRIAMLSKIVAATLTRTGMVCASMRDRQWMWDGGPPVKWHVQAMGECTYIVTERI